MTGFVTCLQNYHYFLKIRNLCWKSKRRFKRSLCCLCLSVSVPPHLGSGNCCWPSPPQFWVSWPYVTLPRVGETYKLSHPPSPQIAQGSSKLLLVLPKIVLLGFGPRWNPWPNFCSSPDPNFLKPGFVYVYVLFMGYNKGISIWTFCAGRKITTRMRTLQFVWNPFKQCSSFVYNYAHMAFQTSTLI
jgi:hypothetical protein